MWRSPPATSPTVRPPLPLGRFRVLSTHSDGTRAGVSLRAGDPTDGNGGSHVIDSGDCECSALRPSGFLERLTLLTALVATDTVYVCHDSRGLGGDGSHVEGLSEAESGACRQHTVTV